MRNIINYILMSDNIITRSIGRVNHTLVSLNINKTKPYEDRKL